MSIPSTSHAVVDLRPVSYQASINSLRTVLSDTDARVKFLLVGLITPDGNTLHLQMRRQNAYLTGFKGADGWYCFNGEEGAWGRPCGIGSNYSELGRVGRITYDDLRRLGGLAQFQSGVALDKRLCAILIAVTSEAARFATVATYFTGLTNSVGTSHSPYLQGGVDFEFLKNTYFNHWEKPPNHRMEVGQVYHFTRGEILLAHRR